MFQVKMIRGPMREVDNLIAGNTRGPRLRADFQTIVSSPALKSLQHEALT